MAIHEAQPTTQRIVPNPYRPGADSVVLAEHGISVWAIIGAITQAGDTPEEAAAAYDIPVEYVYAALDYYRGHTAVIDARIAANSPALFATV